MKKKPFAAALLVAGLALAAGPQFAPPAAAQDSADDEVIAVVNGQNLYRSDLMAFIQQLPPQLQAQVQMLMPQILDQLVNNELTAQAGRKAGLADDEQVKTRLAKIENLIVGQTFLQRAIDEKVTDAAVDEAYQKFLAENPPERQLKARHILVKTEEEAREVIAALDGGADFATLAKEKSTGPSGANGGELPVFKAGEMVPAFSDAAFALEPGTYSKEPVKTQFGYHVILVEESTMTEPPAKEQMEEQLRGQLEQQAAGAVYDDLRKGAEIDVLLGKQKEEQVPPAEGEAPADSAAPADGEPAPTTETPAPGSN